MEYLKRQLSRLAVGATVCLLTISTSMSDDIDVYVAPPDAALPGDTFVIFTLDLHESIISSTQCNGDICDELFNDVGMGHYLDDGQVSYVLLLTAALRKVLDELNNAKIKVALMIPHEQGTGRIAPETCVGYQGNNPDPSCSNGAYVLSAFKSTGDSDEKEEFYEKLQSIPSQDDTQGTYGHSYQLRELFFEMYRYITGGPVHNSENGWEDFNSPDELNIDDIEDTASVLSQHGEDADAGIYTVAELMWDEEAVHNSTRRYQNTIADTADHCSSIFSINLTAGTANADSESDYAIEMDQDSGGLGITLSGGNFNRRTQVLEYLANTDLDNTLVGSQHVTSYFINKESGGSGNVGGRANDWAQAGGTGSALIATEDPDELVRLLSGLFNEILGVSTTFVAASVPANVFNRAETLNEVFLAIFEPDEAEKPFWVGNIKKLTTRTIDEVISCEDLNNDGDTLDDGECLTEERKILVDVLEADKTDPTSAINPLDGRIRAGALTYWTRTGTNNEYLPPPPPPDPADPAQQDEYTEGTDGRKVDRGGAGQVKPGYLGDSNSPGENNGVSPTADSGPRLIFTEPGSNDMSDSDLVDLDADSEFSTAVNLLTDSRDYPGSSSSYGDFLFQTVMEDCATCPDSYGDADQAVKETAQLRVNNLIRFARGFAFGGDSPLDTPMSTTLDKRDWWQADPLHSRPLALNYGARSGALGDYSEDDPDIRVIVAGNDGIVQMIRDGHKPSDSSEDGVEAWAFLPREFVPLQKRLLLGSTGLYNPGVPVAEGDPPRTPLHPYAMDGAPTALVIDNNLDGTIDTDAGDKAYLFVGQRRGGKRYYALDISDPDNPAYLWSIGKDDAGGDFAEMGQSWSLMRAGIMQINEGSADVPDIKRRPVLVFTGGYNGDDGGDGVDLGKDIRYDPGDDGIYDPETDQPAVGTDDDEGNALFIVNALTGELIWKAIGPSGEVPANNELEVTGLVDSVAASPTIVDSSGDGMIDRVYFADTGGNVWRMDAASTDPGNWTVHKLFEGGRHDPAASGKADDRRFFNAPDVVFADDVADDFDAVILASGDRAHPLGTDVNNWLYMIKDRNTTSGNVDSTDLPLNHADLADLTDNCFQGGDISNCGDPQQTNIDNGWKIELNNCEAGGTSDSGSCGEKGLASPVTIEGTIYLTSYLPVVNDQDPATPETCGPKEGGGLFYALDLQTAGGVLDFDPSSNSGGVAAERFDRLHSPGIPPEYVPISPEEGMRPDLEIQKTKGRKSAKTFWYERRFE